MHHNTLLSLLSIVFMQVSTLKFQNQDYPELLREIKNPPKQLFVLGQLPADAVALAVVGSRRPSDYGREVTYKLTYELAKAGIIIVSGLAYGIDAVAHAAALEAGGVTVAVQACGYDQVYPAGNRGLAKQIQKHGAVVTEYPPGTPALKQNFVARNRIIAGLCLATIVTDAAARSGALITANFALNGNRQVMAVPGNITSPTCAGPNNLIKAGALPITDSSDVLSALEIHIDQPALSTRADSKEESKILELLGQGLRSTQELIDQSGLTAGQFASTIGLMEISGKVRNLGAGNWLPR